MPSINEEQLTVGALLSSCGWDVSVSASGCVTASTALGASSYMHRDMLSHTLCSRAFHA